MAETREHHPPAQDVPTEAPPPIALPDTKWALEPGERRELLFGRRTFRLEREGKACWTLSIFKYPPDPVEPAEEGEDDDGEEREPEPRERIRYATAGTENSAALTIGGSTMPLLVKFGQGGVTILPEDHTTLMFLAPMWLCVTLKNKPGSPLFDGPCRTLSKAWSGTNISGMEAREWRTDLLWTPPDVPNGPEDWDLVCCTIQIENRTEKPLKFDRLTVRLDSSPIFLGNDHLWTGVYKVVQLPGTKGTEVTQTRKPPPEAGTTRTAFPARSPQSGNLVSLSLGSLVGGLVMRA